MQVNLFRSSLLVISLLALGLSAPTAADAKSKGKSCAAAEAVLATTGVGDRDGDGLSDCRERRQLGTLMTSADTDGDSVPDGAEIAQHSDPLDVDSDDDGAEDGDDDSPGIPEQKVEGFLDALTCPQVGVLGSITVLGLAVPLSDMTTFEDTTCDAIAAQFAAGTPPVVVEVEVLEDVNHALTAAEVEVEHEEQD